jgi:hypothetical protein
MRGLIIRDGVAPGGEGSLEFDLAEVLTALGERVATSQWRVRGLWYTSRDEKDIEPLDRLGNGASIDGADLLECLPRLLQVIDGEFAATTHDASSPWVIVRAVDSSWWEVLSDDPAVLAAIRSRFRAVEFFPIMPV